MTEQLNWTELKSIANDWTTKACTICHGVWTPCCCGYWPSTSPERVQGGVRHSVLQGIWWDRSLDSWMFLGTDVMISILASPLSREALNPFMVLHQIFMTNKKTFCKMSASWYWTPPSPKPYKLTFPHYCFGAVSQRWDAASRAAVLIVPQIKLNSQLSSCTSFLVDTILSS